MVFRTNERVEAGAYTGEWREIKRGVARGAAGCYIRRMDRIDLSRDHPSLEELVARAAAGETVEIVSDGKLTARISPVEALNETPKAPFDFESLRALHARQIAAGAKITSSSVVEMRKSYRY